LTVMPLPLRECENAPLTGSAPARRGWLAPCALVVVLLAGAAIRAHDLGVECFDEDELYAVRIQGTSLHALGAVIGRDGFHTNHPPIMSVPFLYWNALFGSEEARVRALPLLLGLAAVFLTYRLGLRLAGPGTAVLAALLLAINPLHIA
jgi:4-amino-4-deoxy-L-arabinose transferase-like glycosyltransferase